MLKIKKLEEGNNILFQLEGKLDTTTAPDLNVAIKGCDGHFRDLILDFEKLESLSSAGLRVLLFTHQDMKDGQRLLLKKVPELILDILEITGFTDILNIEQE
jgi:anti-sigma B factor antagonist